MLKVTAAQGFIFGIFVCLSAEPCTSDNSYHKQGALSSFRASRETIRLRGGDDWKANSDVLSRRRLVKGRRSEGSGLKSGFFEPSSSTSGNNMGWQSAPQQAAHPAPPFQVTSPSFMAQQPRNPMDAAPGRLWGGMGSTSSLSPFGTGFGGAGGSGQSPPGFNFTKSPFLTSNTSPQRAPTFGFSGNIPASGKRV